MGDWAEGHEPLYDLEERFARTFGPRGEILDCASPELAAMRAELKSFASRCCAPWAAGADTALEHVVQRRFHHAALEPLCGAPDAGFPRGTLKGSFTTIPARVRRSSSSRSK